MPVKKPEHEPDPAGPLYWMIESQSDPDGFHLVYLGGNQGVGVCFCTWARTEVTPAVRRGEKPKKLCHHLTEAHRRYHKWKIWQDVQSNPNHSQDDPISGGP